MEFTTYLLAQEAPPLELPLRISFSVLHFLEFAIWGAWYVVLGNYLNSLNFSRKWIGSIYATIPLGAIVAPIFGGTIADRYMDAEILFGILHLVGAVFLVLMASMKRPLSFFIAALLYALAYSPTLALVNSIVFAHLQDGERDFPSIRVLGTIGWILAGLSLKLFIRKGEPVNNRPLLLAAFLSVLLGVFSFSLPEPPPAAEAAPTEVEAPLPPSGTMQEVAAENEAAEMTWAEAIPFLKALQMMNDYNFGTFIAVSFLITIALAFYFSFTAIFLEQEIHVRSENVGPLMTLGQWVEIIFIFTLPMIIAAVGMKWVLAIGMLGWGLRYAFFAAGRPFALILLGIALHGICFDFFFVAGFIYVDNAAPESIAASAQSLFAVVTYGLGMWLGTELSGWLNERLTTVKGTHEPTEVGEEPPKETNWRLFWAIPSVAVFVCLLLFVVLFRG